MERVKSSFDPTSFYENRSHTRPDWTERRAIDVAISVGRLMSERPTSDGQVAAEQWTPPTEIMPIIWKISSSPTSGEQHFTAISVYCSFTASWVGCMCDDVFFSALPTQRNYFGI